MPSKPRTLAGILRLRLRRHTDRAYNLVPRDPATARIHGSARWQAIRAKVLRDEPICRACARLGLTEPATTVDHAVGVAAAPERAYDPTNLQPPCTLCRVRHSVQPAIRGSPQASGGPGGVTAHSRIAGGASWSPRATAGH